MQAHATPASAQGKEEGAAAGRVPERRQPVGTLGHPVFAHDGQSGAVRGEPTLRDLEVRLPNRPHALADLTRAIGDAGVSLDGGGMFAPGAAHYLVSVPDEPIAARLVEAARSVEARSVRLNRVLLAHLDQETPGQLGVLLTRLADAGVWVRTQYSDHAGALVLVVDPADVEAAHPIVASWESRRESPVLRTNPSSE